MKIFIEPNPHPNIGTDWIGYVATSSWRRHAKAETPHELLSILMNAFVLYASKCSTL